MSEDEIRISKWKIGTAITIAAFFIPWGAWVTASAFAANSFHASTEHNFEELTNAVKENTKSQTKLQVAIARLEERIKDDM